MRRRAVDSPRGGIRARTRTLLLEAATRVFARKGVGETAIHEITAEAGVANGTFYNYFRTREEIAEAVGASLAERLEEQITASYRNVADPAERVAIGSRTFVLQALRDPDWAAAILRVTGRSTELATRIARPVIADLRAGRRRRRFHHASELAALDLVQGAVLAGMRTVVEGRAGEEHAAAVAALVIHGLGVPFDEAEEIARRPLPRS
jgi:AcrR family transcriptional regulator